jgi:hypothetical protein
MNIILGAPVDGASDEGGAPLIPASPVMIIIKNIITGFVF